MGVADARTGLLLKFRSGTHRLNKELVGIGVGKVIKSVSCVVVSVTVLVMCCGSVRLIVVVELTFC